MDEGAVVQLFAYFELPHIHVEHFLLVGVAEQGAGVLVGAGKVAEFVAAGFGDVQNGEAGVAIYAGVPFTAEHGRDRWV